MKVLIASSLLFLVNPLLLAQNNPEAITINSPEVQQLMAASRETESLKASFTQEKHMSVLTEPLISTGSFHFEGPGSLRWQVDGASPMVAVVRGKEVRISDNGVERPVNSTERQTYLGVGDLIAGIVSGKILSGQDMKSSFFKVDDGILVELEPSAGRVGKHLQRMRMIFDQKHFLQELRMEQPNGDHTVIRFHDAQRDIVHPPDTFQLP